MCGPADEKLETLQINGPDLAPIAEEPTPRRSVDESSRSDPPKPQRRRSSQESPTPRVTPPPVYPRPIPLKPNLDNAPRLKQSEANKPQNKHSSSSPVRPRSSGSKVTTVTLYCAQCL